MRQTVTKRLLFGPQTRPTTTPPPSATATAFSLFVQLIYLFAACILIKFVAKNTFFFVSFYLAVSGGDSRTDKFVSEVHVQCNHFSGSHSHAIVLTCALS